MGVKLSEKRREAKLMTVTWDADDVEVSYLPNAVTPKLMEEIEEAAQRDDMSVIGTLLEPVLDWWDVLDDDGQRIGTDKDTIAGLPMRWLLVVQKGIQDDQDPEGDGTEGGES